MSLRNVIEKARQSGDLVTISRPVDLEYELANVAHALEGSLVLFEAIKGYPGWRVLSGQCADRRYLSMDMDVTPGDLVGRLARAIETAVEPEIVELGKGITEDDLLFHDEKAPEPSLAYLLSRMRYPEFPEPIGVFRAVDRPKYDDELNRQITEAIEKKGPGDLNTLFHSGDTWTVPA